ncbi:hypothetical protein MD484_g1017, partial [Candolleomyces efflorescens]
MEVARGKFYNEDTHFVVIQAENVLHRVPRYALVQHSELFRDMFQLPQQPVGGDESGSRKEASTPGGEGSRDENPIKIPACFTNFEFESLLEFIYPAGKTKSLSQEQLLAAFKLATHWEMHDMISNIENCILTLELTPTEKLKLGKEWKIRKLLEQGFFSFVAQMKYEPSAEEASGLGWDAVGQILLMRENLRRQTMAMPVELMFLRCKGKSGKPVSASGVASAAAASGVTTAGRRSLQGRTLSANAIFSGSGTAGREHRVGGDDSNLRSKGKAKESNAGKGADDMDMDVDTPATVWKVPQVSVGSTGSIKGAGNAGAGPSRGADTCAMPPPALPPERLQQGLRAAQPSGITQNSVGQHQRPQPSAVPAISAIPSSQQSVQGPTVPVQASSQQQHQSSKPHLSQTSNLHISAPAPPSGAFNASSTSTSATTTVKVNAPASTTTTTHFASVPAAPATTTTVRSSKPPVLGMRRAHTFVSSSGSNNSAHVFGSQQQAPSSQYSSNRHANGLPTKQRAFKAPSFQKPPQAQAQGQLAPQPQLYPHPTTTATSATSNAPSTAFSRASSSSSFSSSVLKPTPSGHSSDTSLGVPAAIPVQPNNAYVKTQAVTPVGGTNQNPSANHRQARFNTPTTTFVFAAGASNSGSSTTRAKLNSSEDSGLMRSKSSESTASSASSNSIQSSGFERSGWSSSGTSVASNSSGKNHIRGEVVFELEDASEEEELEAGRGRGSVKEGDGDDSSMLVESGEDPDSSYGDISFDLDELEEVCKNYD